MASYKLVSPIRICYYITKAGDKRWFTLNLNQYRNANPHMLGTVKEAYSLLMAEEVKSLPSFTKPIEIHYRVFVGSFHKSDIMNWVAIIDKFFQDVLTQEHKIVDDNYEHVPKVSCEFGGIDKKNPRLEIEISEIEYNISTTSNESYKPKERAKPVNTMDEPIHLSDYFS